jgi:hypothetical protein
MKPDTISYSDYERLHGPSTVTIQQTTWERYLRIERLARLASAAYANGDSDVEACHEALRKALL